MSPLAEGIFAAAYKLTNCTPSEIRGPSRFKAVVRVRHAVIYALLHRTPWSLSMVGRMLGGRDHSTVIHARDKAAERMAEDPDFAALVAALIAASPWEMRFMKLSEPRVPEFFELPPVVVALPPPTSSLAEFAPPEEDTDVFKRRAEARVANREFLLRIAEARAAA